MQFDLDGSDNADAYKLLAGLVTPRPIALVTTCGDDGKVNAAPFSFFNVFGSKPPVLAFAPGDKSPEIPKDTARNIRLNQEFVVNLVDEAIGSQMVSCAATLEYGESELEQAGLSATPSETITPPRIAEAPVSIECREWGTLQIGGNRLVIGLAGTMHVRDGILDPGTLRVNQDTYKVIGRMHGPDGYTRTRDFFAMTRPD